MAISLILSVAGNLSLLFLSSITDEEPRVISRSFKSPIQLRIINDPFSSPQPSSDNKLKEHTIGQIPSLSVLKNTSPTKESKVLKPLPKPVTFFSSQDQFQLNGQQYFQLGQISIKNEKNEDLPIDKYYSFYLRIFNDYLNKLIIQLNQKNSLNGLKSNEVLMGRIIFDELGNAQELKIIQWADSDKLQNSFFKTLEEIKNIPNPPQDLISSGEKFTVYYGLKINL